jgi:mannose-6-phosphate isomerase-like protein (cupin superfamily)
MSNPEDFPYRTILDIRYPPLQVVDVPDLVGANSQHDNDDEFFFVLDGVFCIDLEDRVVELQPRQGFVVPRGVVHRTRAPQRAVILMVETSAIVPTGD